MPRCGRAAKNRAATIRTGLRLVEPGAHFGANAGV
jgi:hypothetical protein